MPSSKRGQAVPGLRVARELRHRLLEAPPARPPRGSAVVSIDARTSSGSGVSGLSVLGVLRPLDAPASNLRSSASASASFVALSEASGCQIAQASSAGGRDRRQRRDDARPRRAPAERRRARVAASLPNGPRPATKPAASSAITAGAGMNQVQSSSDWTPNTSGTSSTVTSAIAPRVPVAPWRRLVALRADQPARQQAGGAQRGHGPGQEQQRREREPEQAEVGHRLRDPPVRVARDRRRRCGGAAGRRRTRRRRRPRAAARRRPGTPRASTCRATRRRRRRVRRPPRAPPSSRS